MEILKVELNSEKLTRARTLYCGRENDSSSWIWQRYPDDEFFDDKSRQDYLSDKEEIERLLKAQNIEIVD